MGNTWLFEEEDLLHHSPSRKQLNITQELKILESIYDFVIKLGTNLKLNGGTILAATIYIHRFYVRYPITTSKYFVAGAAIAISTKLNDNYRPPDKIALAGCLIKNPNKLIDEHSEIFWQWRDQLLYREELILKALNFELNLDLPYPIRDDLLLKFEETTSDGNIFYDKLKEILRNVISLIELLSSLPVLLCYDVNAFFGAMLVVTIIEGKQRFNDKNTELFIPPHFFSENLSTTVDESLKCYKFIMRLLKYADKPDPKLSSHQAAIKRLPVISDEEFLCIAND